MERVGEKKRAEERARMRAGEMGEHLGERELSGRGERLGGGRREGEIGGRAEIETDGMRRLEGARGDEGVNPDYRPKTAVKIVVYFRSSTCFFCQNHIVVCGPWG